MVEIWLPVIGKEGRYEVSDAGRVRSLCVSTGHGRKPRREPLVLAPRRLKSGHLRVSFGHGEEEQIHRLVLFAFVGPPGEGREGSHLNGDPADNRLSNLTWETRRENFARKLEHGTHNGGDAHPLSKLSMEQAEEAKRRVASGETCTAVARSFGVVPSTISRIVAGKRWNTVRKPHRTGPE